jgi:hypothetical protein
MGTALTREFHIADDELATFHGRSDNFTGYSRKPARLAASLFDAVEAQKSTVAVPILPKSGGVSVVAVLERLGPCGDDRR